MAITGIDIIQTNITASCNLLAVHSPVVFLVDVSYTSSVPEILNVDLLDSFDNVLNTFVCIPYSDRTGVRTFAFIAHEAIRAYIGSFDDFESAEKVLEYCDGITREFKLTFYDPDAEETNDSVEFVAIHSARQFGETPYLESIYNNVDEYYYGAAGMPIYLYIYNNSETNIITVGTGDITFLPLLDYDDVMFYDFDDLILLSL